jgi:hypothetical protein
MVWIYLNNSNSFNWKLRKIAVHLGCFWPAQPGLGCQPSSEAGEAGEPWPLAHGWRWRRPLPAVTGGEGSGEWVLERVGSAGIRFWVHWGQETHRGVVLHGGTLRRGGTIGGGVVWRARREAHESGRSSSMVWCSRIVGAVDLWPGAVGDGEESTVVERFGAMASG